MSLIYRFQASYAGVPIQVLNWTLNRGRAVIQHRPARGNGAQLSDRGQQPRIDQLTVTLTGSDADITAARDTLLELDGNGEARTFVHPLDGQWEARLEAFSETAGPEGVSYALTLIEDLDFPTRISTSVQSDTASIEEVRTAASRLETARDELATEDAELAAGVPDPAATLATAESWDATSTPAAQIATDLEEVRSTAGPAQERLDQARTRRAYDAGVALLELRGAVERYARRLQAISPRTFAVDVLADVPLISLLTRIYGADEGGRLAAEVVRVNSIINPVRVRAGSVLRLPVRDS